MLAAARRAGPSGPCFHLGGHIQAAVGVTPRVNTEQWCQVPPLTLRKPLAPRVPACRLRPSARCTDYLKLPARPHMIFKPAILRPISTAA